MEPLTTFTDAEVLDDTPPSNWVKITSLQTSEPMDPAIPWEQTHSMNHRAQARGLFVAACSVGQLKPSASAQAASPSPTPTWKVES